jgi:hypothetical protein
LCANIDRSSSGRKRSSGVGNVGAALFCSSQEDAAEIARRRRRPAGQSLRLPDADDGARAQLKAARIAFARQPT